jgi:hypothetical protein
VTSRAATEQEVVSAFLQADYRAPRPEPRQCLQSVLGTDTDALVLYPNHHDARDNARRKDALFRCRRELPELLELCSSFTWQLTSLTSSELAELRLLAYTTFRQIAPQTRRVGEAAGNVDDAGVQVGEGLKGRIRDLEFTLRRGPSLPMPPLIAVAEASEAPHVLIDGNTRAIAYARANSGSDVFVGYCANVEHWSFFGAV